MIVDLDQVKWYTYTYIGLVSKNTVPCTVQSISSLSCGMEPFPSNRLPWPCTVRLSRRAMPCCSIVLPTCSGYLNGYSCDFVFGIVLPSRICISREPQQQAVQQWCCRQQRAEAVTIVSSRRARCCVTILVCIQRRVKYLWSFHTILYLVLWMHCS